MLTVINQRQATRNHVRTTRGATRALSNRGFRLLWIGQLASFSGSWMQAVAQACVVLSLTRSPLALGLLTVTQFTPALVLSLPAGVLADRLPKRRLVLALQSVMLMLTVVLAMLVTTRRLELWHVYVLAALLGSASALEIPARQSLTPELLSRDQVANGIALNQTAATLAQIAGPIVGGLIARQLGYSFCYWINVVSFAVMVISLLLMLPIGVAASATPARPTSGLRAEMSAGLRHAARTPEVALALLLTGVLGTFGYIFSLVLPLVARDLLNADPSSAGLLMATIGVGSLVASLALAGRKGATPRSVLVGAGGFSVLLLATARAPGWAMTVPLLIGVGAFSAMFLTSSMTLIQMATPPELRGRVMSIASLLSLGAKPLGAMMIGALATRFGVQAALTVAAVLCTTGVLAGMTFLMRVQRQAGGAPSPAPRLAAAHGV